MIVFVLGELWMSKECNLMFGFLSLDTSCGYSVLHEGQYSAGVLVAGILNV